MQGLGELAEFLVPVMVDRWSKLALSISEDKINLFVYCHNYTTTTLEQSLERLEFSESSLLMIGHGGSVLPQPFKVSSLWDVESL